jgi:hypothetical protein
VQQSDLQRLTSRPDPTNPKTPSELAWGAHNRRSPGGPRYDGSMTSDERASVENGIWLCQPCGKTIDDAPEAFPKESLRARKSWAEFTAARDSVAVQDEINALLADIDAAHAALVNFSHSWQQSEPAHDFSRFKESTEALLRHSDARKAAYYREINPMVCDVVTRAEVIIGGSAPELDDCKIWSEDGPTNYIGMYMLAGSLQRLRTISHAALKIDGLPLRLPSRRPGASTLYAPAKTVARYWQDEDQQL